MCFSTSDDFLQSPRHPKEMKQLPVPLLSLFGGVSRRALHRDRKEFQLRAENEKTKWGLD
jgi:hypothetical protein